MYTLKSIAQRSTLLSVVAAFVVAAVLPAALVAAQQALNPLTERSLLLSSSAPGYQDTDGSGYSIASPNPASDGTDVPETYAPAGSGPNGKKTGQTFTFRTSSSADIHAMTFQYCTVAAGLCNAPGNNTGDARDTEPGTTDPRTPDRQANTGTDGGWANATSDLDITGEFQHAAAAPGAGEFQISVNDVEVDTDWTFTSTNQEDDDFIPALNNRLSGKNNFITIQSTDGYTIPAGARVKIEFKASENVFITNPGAGHFFVKINTYSDAGATTIVDGGVTVANVMTDSIHITTKVLETMAFSVGTQNPDTVQQADPTDHGTCDAINQFQNNRIELGDPMAEYSLQTTRAWDAYSYWRLSSNSSGGATVYYSGNTLANTVGDEIAEMDTKAVSRPGTEQFGLGFVDISNPSAHGDTLSTSFQSAITTNPDRFRAPNSYPFITVAGQGATSTPGRDFTSLNAQPISDDYADATGTTHDGTGAGTAQFKFLSSSSEVPEPIAQQNETVISCATAKMRYVGNIGADTPAGVYTTKVNYLAAPQY